MKTNTSLLLALCSLIFGHSALGMDDFFEQLQDSEAATKKAFEETYQFLAQDKGLSEAEILEMANTAPELTQLAIQECKSAGKLSQSTLNRLLPYVQKISRTKADAEQITQILIEQATICGTVELFALKQNAASTRKFQEFIHQKQNFPR